ncbi:MAG: prepilin-type N-terminal cleavage/methylation domain-containing protein [Planctomycetota bacterium]
MKITKRSGFTLLELLLAATLLGIVAYKAHGAMKSASKSLSVETERAFVEDQARQVINMIAFAIMGSNRDTLVPDEFAGTAQNTLTYQINLGIEDGAVVWSDPNRVAQDMDMSQVYWSQNPEAENERRVAWTNLVAPYMAGEIPNGMDDNGNGLIDEKGLAFSIQGNAVTIRLTLEKVQSDGSIIRDQVSRTVTCRNLGSDS